MSNLNRRPLRRAAAGVLAGTLALSGAAVAATASPASALPGFTFERIEGVNRYETAANIARSAFPTGTEVAIVARGDVFADALTANYLAGAIGAPVLLTTSRGLPEVTTEVLAELGVQAVVIVGGTTAVSQAVEDELAADYDVDRLGGADRYLTAELVAATTAAVNEGAVGEFNGLRTAILGSGQSFPDVLAAAPLSYAGNHPLLITRPTGLPESTEDVLVGLDIEQVILVGGTDVVPKAVADRVATVTGNPVVRLFGQTRYETAAAIAEAAYDDFGFDEAHVNLARGDVFADALAGGPHAGEEMAPIVLTTPTTLAPATAGFLEDHSDTLVDGHIFGGVNAVNSAVEEAAEDAATGDTVPVDTTPPAAAVLSGPTVATTTNSATFAITGTAEAGAIVRVLRASDRAVLGTGTADATTGAFSIDPDLVEGANDVVIVVVDAAGNVSTATTVPTITQDTTAPTAELDPGAVGGRTITVTYSERVTNSTATVQDFTIDGVELSAATATITTKADAQGRDVSTVTLVDPLQAGDVIVLEAGAVRDLAGNRGPVEALTGTPAGPPAFMTAVASLNGTGNDTIVLNYSEVVAAVGGTYDNRQFFYDADCDGGVNDTLGVVAQGASGTSLTLSLADGTVAADDANDCVRYVDTNAASDTGDVVDGQGNTQVSGDNVVVTSAAV